MDTSSASRPALALVPSAQSLRRTVGAAASPVEVRAVPGMGRGVFAARPIAANEEIGRFHTIRIPPDEVRAMAGCTLADYWFEDDADGAAYVVLGVIELVNHARTPSLERRWEQTASGEIVVLYALHDIAAGEQLFIDYRFEGKPTDPAWA